ncbi:FAD-dependent oxidoreductase [uncultured Rhodospira sp.]|uniref:FAD-dependent oxidoreductase n=1 Tax=uncultured Rhodospira sp. TaxID=1936189 RepID=UPI00263592C4|nr:FAD-dependent oxidoreductase [uncultured Rhodospira sp.]
MEDVVYIIGGGISGLGAAHFARAHGLKPVVLEASDSVGGRAGAICNGEQWYETGGKNFASDWTLFNGILRTFHPPSFDRQHPSFHIVINGRLHGFDKRAALTNGLTMMRGIGLGGVLRFNALLRRAARERGDLAYFGDAIRAYEERHDDQPVTAYVPRALAQGPLRMFTVIMGAAEPDEFSFATLMLLLASFGKGSHHSLPQTTRVLFDYLARDVDTRTGHRVTNVVVENGRVRAVEGRAGEKPFRYQTGKVITATPLHRLPHILELSSEAGYAAQSIPYHPLALINADYDADVFTPTMNSIMFDVGSPLGHCSANRMYKRHSVRFTLSGRHARPLLVLDDERLVSVAENAFRRVHPIPGKRRFTHVTRHLGGICAYGFHYSLARRRLLAELDRVGGLAFAGDYLFGHNMEGCLQSAMAAVRHLTGETECYQRLHEYPQDTDSSDAPPPTQGLAPPCPDGTKPTGDLKAAMS